MSDNVRSHQERESIMTKTSRFNYIKRGLVGVCAATMLTGLCAGTAFGAATDVANETPVTVNTQAINISVTVPTATVSAVVDAGGAFADVAGGNFVNNSVCGVHVSNVEVKTAGSSFTLQTAADFIAGSNTTENAAKLSASVAGAELDMADYTTKKAPTADVKFASGATQALKFSGAVKNLTGATMNEEALTFVSVAWTVAADA